MALHHIWKNCPFWSWAILSKFCTRFGAENLWSLVLFCKLKFHKCSSTVRCSIDATRFKQFRVSQSCSVSKETIDLTVKVNIFWEGHKILKNLHLTFDHRRRKHGRFFPNSLRPISYFGSIWELCVLDLKTKVFCRKEIQLHFPMNKGLTVTK